MLSQKIQFNTFGGNPVCSAGGLAVLNVLNKEKRQEHCANVGSHLIERLRNLQQKHDSNFLHPFKFLVYSRIQLDTSDLIQLSSNVLTLL